MHRRWISRALVALVVPATLAAPALVGSAQAVAAPRVPSLAQATAIYPHLAGGTATQSSGKVFGIGKRCKPGKAIKGAAQTSVSYAAPVDYTDPGSYLPSGAKPGLSVAALRFRSAKSAVAYLHAVPKSTKKCGSAAAGAPGSKPTVTPIRFKLGDERKGLKMKLTVDGQTVIMDYLFVRQGKVIIYTTAMSFDGVAPAVPPAVALTKVALKTAR